MLFRAYRRRAGVWTAIAALIVGGHVCAHDLPEALLAKYREIGL
ncbi:MAG: hypothetical protein ACK5H2_11605 [Beutenbergiaceae bacterium]